MWYLQIKDVTSFIIYFVIMTYKFTGVYCAELCYTDYYTLEYCDHGCCGTDLEDRHCCTKPVELETGTIIGCSVGGGVLLIIIIIIIVLLCKYTHKKDIHPDDNTLSSISDHTGESVARCDTSCNHHFPGVIHVYPGSYTKRVGLNSHVIKQSHSIEEEGTSTSHHSGNAPPVFVSRTSDNKSAYRDVYTPSEQWNIPDIIAD